MKKYLLLLLLCGCIEPKEPRVENSLQDTNKFSHITIEDNYANQYRLSFVSHSNHNFAVLIGRHGAALVELKELMPERQNILYVITNR